MTSVLWPFHKHYHPEAGWVARVRCFYWVVIRRHETEICALCGGPVNAVWHAPDPFWRRASGFPTNGGVLCMECFGGRGNVYWEAGDGIWPSCGADQCPHAETVDIVVGHREEMWDWIVAEGLEQRFRDRRHASR